jgi:UDP-N-acetylmuramate-alanine ligase
MVVSEILKRKKEVRFVKNKDEAMNVLRDELESGDVVVIMAVGSFNRLGYDLLSSLQQ